MGRIISFTIIVMVVFAPCVMAQEDDWKKYIPQLNLYFRTSLEIPSQDTSDEDIWDGIPQRFNDEASIRLNEARIEVMGNLNPDLYYRVRWRMNAAQELDYAMAGYRFGPSKQFFIDVGKQILFQGAWELDKNPTFEYQYSDYINYQLNIFLMAAKFGYDLNDKHTLYLQLHNTFNESFDERHDMFGYDKNGFEAADLPLGLIFAWRGKLFDGLVEPNWSIDISQFGNGETQYSIGIGNKLLLPKFECYLDFSFSHYPVDYPGVASRHLNAITGNNVFAQNADYFTAVTRIDYNFMPKLYLTAKGIYEKTFVDDEDFAWENIAGLIGLEYKPFEKHEMKLFMYYFPNTRRMDLGGSDTTLNQHLVAFGLLYSGDVLQAFKW